MQADVQRVPEPFREWVRRRGWDEHVHAPCTTLRDLRAANRILEEFTPLGTHLDWRLSEHYWATRGVLAFAENHVPYVINNSGTLSEQLARVVFAACEANPPRERFWVAELGAGSGLFAKLFLDAFELACTNAGRDYYDRLMYLATDSSPLVIAQWRERGVFADHRGHVETVALRAADGLPEGLHPRTVICNYVLDVLPATIARRCPDGTLERLHVRTQLAEAGDADAPALDELRRLAARTDPEALEILSNHSLSFELEIEFMREAGALADELREACASALDLERVLYNHTALRCVLRVLSQLDAHGFMLINDYGPTDSAEATIHATYQRFGATSAFGLNFPVLERMLERRGMNIVKATGDSSARLHSRLLSAAPLPGVSDVFERCFCEATRLAAEQGLARAREHVEAGRKAQALEAYQTCLERSPRDWALLGEVTEFVIREINDYTGAVALARGALSSNGIYSTWLWNLLGDALLQQGQTAEAHDAYLQAERINPRDTRTNLGLAESYMRLGQLDEALIAIARGLACDHESSSQERFLTKQRAVLATLSSRMTDRKRSQVRCQERLRNIALHGAVRAPVPT